MNGDFLAAMAGSSRERAARARKECPLHELQARCADLPPPPPLRLSPLGFDLVAELKLRSPAAGQLAKETAADLAARARAYAEAGVAAVSVLTEPTRFDGALKHLELVAGALNESAVPAMRKDFLVEPYQVFEARAAGAGGVLVILRMLDRAALAALIDTALALRLFVLLEAFDAADLALAAELIDARCGVAAALLVGVNCRDLTTLQVLPERLQSLSPLLPRGVPGVAESGIETPQDAATAARAGYRLALVGSALMMRPDPRALARELLAEARAACG